jgi:hypothetical protein
MEKKPYYVLITGSKNNAGDYLIKHRAFQLFKVHRPDRELIDIDAWKQRDENILEVFNQSQAIILTGGPALRPKMYPDIYKVLGNLDDIKVPIITMAIGWRAFPGEWLQTHSYKFSSQSLKLLKRIESSGYQSSVRDYHSLNVLLREGFHSFNMTGCAALYDLDTIGKPYPPPNIRRVAFSLGIAFATDGQHERNFKKLILGLRDKYRDQQFDVAFHHSLDKTQFLKVYENKTTFYQKHVEFSQWLKSENISYTDISGSAETMINYYNKVDLHVGYRVHAHIYMSSVNKFSILIAEDGRGKAQRDAMSGLVLDSEFLQAGDPKSSLFSKSLIELKIMKRELVNKFITEDVLKNLEYEEKSGFNRVMRTRAMIDSLYAQMKSFIQQLP